MRLHRRYDSDDMLLSVVDSAMLRDNSRLAMGRFEEITAAIVALHEAKNADYGNAFAESFERYERIRPGAGLEYAVGRMGDKMGRITNLAFKGGQKVKDESIADTLMDLAAYAIMTVEAFENKEG